MRAYLLPLIAGAALLSLPLTSARALQDPSLEQVQRMIHEEGLHWTAGPTSVSGQSWAEFSDRLTFRLPPDYASLPKVDPSRRLDKAHPLPDVWDWREHEGTTPVQDQGNCGSCWAFASVGALEAGARLDDQVIYDLSEQEVLSCNNLGQGCNGGWFEASFDVFHRLGAVAEECMPYQGRDGVPCTVATCEPEARADSLIWLEPGVAAIKAAVYLYGPVACGMAVLEDFKYYNSGCYDNPALGDVNHAVVIVGWDETACGGEWICKNSWGTGWGEEGWFRINYESCAIGYGAAVFHHVPRQRLLITPTVLPTTSGGGQVFTVSAQIECRGRAELNPDSVLLNYRVNGGSWIQRHMQGAPEARQWEAQIPAQTKPASIDYFLTASSLEHQCVRAPQAVQPTYYSFDLARVYETFEDGPGGWTVGDPSDLATSGIWTCVAPVGTDAQPGSNHTPGGSKCWVTGQGTPGGSNGENDVDGGSTTLYSPVYDLSGAHTAIVKYWRWFSNDRGSMPNSDPWVVQVRRLGHDWIDLERTPASSDTWVQVTRDLHLVLDPALGQVQFRFIATDDDPPSCVEAALDDFEILGEEMEAAKDSPPQVRVQGQAEATLSPNPLLPGVELRIPCPTAGAAPGAAEVAVYSASGRLVRSIPLSNGGSREAVWDGRDGEGRPVAAGAYFYTVGRGAGAGRGRVVVVR
jgi:C1A family cysteine protease